MKKFVYLKNNSKDMLIIKPVIKNLLFLIFLCIRKLNRTDPINNGTKDIFQKP